MCNKLCKYFILLVLLLVTPIVSGDEEDATDSNTTTQSIDGTTELSIESSTESTTESATGSSGAPLEDISTDSTSVTESVTKATSDDSTPESTSVEPEPGTEPEGEPEGEPEDEPETEPEGEPEAKPETKTKPEALTGDKPKADIKKEDTGVLKPGEKPEDKCSCPVSDVLVSMADLLKELNSEIQSMKNQMIEKCPGFGDGNATDSLDSLEKVDDSIDTLNASDKSTKLEGSDAEVMPEDVSTTTPLPPIPTTCNPPFQLVASSCYYFLYYTQDWKSWGDANAYCQTLGGTLAAPYRPDDLREYLMENYSNVFWVGAKKSATSESFEWLTGRTVQAEEWKEEHPLKPAAKLCVYLESWSGYKAINFYCGEKFSFICEQREQEEQQ